jgi:hypothetical protein
VPKPVQPAARNSAKLSGLARPTDAGTDNRWGEDSPPAVNARRNQALAEQ